MNRREALAAMGAGAVRIIVPPPGAGVRRYGDGPSQQVEDLIKEAGRITPDEEKWGAESAGDRLMRVINRASDNLEFGAITKNLATAASRIERMLAREARPSSVVLLKTHGRLIALLAQVQMQLGQVEKGLKTLGRLNGERSVGDTGSLYRDINLIHRHVIGEKTADDAVTTLFRLEEKSRKARDFWSDDDVVKLVMDGKETLVVERNRAKLQWRSYTQRLLRGENPDRNEFEDGYKVLVRGGATPAMEEANLKGSLIYVLRNEGKHEEALQVTRRTRELIEPLWNGVSIVPRMTSHMILCHVYLILNIVEEFAGIKGDKSLHTSTGAEIGRLIDSMQASGMTMKADGAWEADAVLATPGKAKILRRPRISRHDRCITTYFRVGGDVVARYLGVADRLTTEAIGPQS